MYNVDVCCVVTFNSQFLLWFECGYFIGVNADEIHLCGEDSVIDLIKNYALDTGDIVEVKKLVYLEQCYYEPISRSMLHM